MFGFLQSEEKKMRAHAANWLEVAERVFHFRRDLLSDGERQLLQGATGELKRLLKEKADAGKLKLSIETLEGVLGRTGGRQYPANSIVENVEFFLVAAIVILGLRAYFIQPFKIPTNSMWPTYYGMTHEMIKTGEEPNLLVRAGRFLAFGAAREEAVAPADGEVYMAVTERGAPVSAVVSARSFFVFPTQKLEYYFSVGNGSEVAKVNVPLDFTFSDVLESAFGDFAPGRYVPLASQYLQEGGVRKRSSYTVTQDGERREYAVYWLSVGKKVKKGEKIISFDILTGDLLFVDRFTYNFFPPKVGQGFVFKTDNIHSQYMEKPPGTQIKQYYIKRLVGAPGDVLEVKSSVLLSHGKPVTGAAAFDKNARHEGLYRGYENRGLLEVGERLTIPANHYFAMGDNSYRSADSRYWGFVPEKDVVGKPLFIYYPLTKRWGPAQ